MSKKKTTEKKPELKPPKLLNNEPVSSVQWLHRSQLKPNHYNPNAVAPPEMDLLEISILSDGWTQPIVINPNFTIVDGFHRYTISERPRLLDKYQGYVPVAITRPKTFDDQMMSTIRHNRARGTHAVLKMGDIIKQMIEDNVPVTEIMHKMQMEEEEVVRLANRMGIPVSKMNMEFGKSWIPNQD